MSRRLVPGSLSLLAVLLPILTHADTVTPQVRRLLERPAHRARVVGLERMGYARDVAERILTLKGTYFVDAVLSPERTARYRPVTVYRGINRPVREYRPSYRGEDGKGVMIRAGGLWVTRDLQQALGFTGNPLSEGSRRPGVVLEYQLPENQRTFTSGDALKLSRLEHLPDDRIYLRRVGLPHLKHGTREVDDTRPPRWISVDRAVKLGIVPAVTINDAAATFE